MLQKCEYLRGRGFGTRLNMSFIGLELHCGSNPRTSPSIDTKNSSRNSSDPGIFSDCVMFSALLSGRYTLPRDWLTGWLPASILFQPSHLFPREGVCQPWGQALPGKGRRGFWGNFFSKKAFFKGNFQPPLFQPITGV